MHINEANLTNLTGLWKKYGSRPGGSTLPLVYSNAHWPYRCWVEWRGEDITDGMHHHADDLTWLNDIPDSAILPIWQTANGSEHEASAVREPQCIEQHLLEKNWHCTFEQLAMYFELQTGASYLPKPRSGFRVTSVRTLAEVKIWVDIGSEAFNYVIDGSVIEDLLHDGDIQMLLGWQDEQAVGCALMYKTGDIIGVHQVGVIRLFQGKGIARSLMQDILHNCVLWQGKYIVLQASAVGQPLYQSLGFNAQFKIKSYQKK